MSQTVDNLHAMRHSQAHILAAALQQLWPKVKFGVGPVVKDGFYYDIDMSHQLTPDDLIKIEKKMKEIVSLNLPFEQFDKSIDAAIKFCQAENQPYKVELLKDLKKYGTTAAKELSGEELGIKSDAAKITTVSFYQTGDFVDLCRGPHVKTTGKAGVFKLTKISGAYWRADQKRAQLQRVYGIGFATREELDEYLKREAEALKRDHRVLGTQLDLFMINDVVGAGLPLFTPKGTVIYNAMLDFSKELNFKYGYQEVKTGHVTRDELYAMSGHLEKYGEDLLVAEARDDKLALKPMNCPHHAMLFKRLTYSYRDLPVRYAEYSTLHRNELKGVLSGLTRPRAFAQDDGHVYLAPEQIEDEITRMLNQINDVFTVYGMAYKVRLSLHDPSKPGAYLGDQKLWQKAESKLRTVVKKLKLDYFEEEGEAAFYGPKLDFMMLDAIGREWQVPTIQLDFNQAERFDLSYAAANGSRQRPVLIHRAIQGSFERTMGVLIEHYAGSFPLWLAPEQVRVITVNDTPPIVKYAKEVAAVLASCGLRVTTDDSNESVGKRIRSAEVQKIPYTLVVGEKEVKTGKFLPRVHAGYAGKEGAKPKLLSRLAKAMAEEVTTRAPRSTL